MKLSTAIIIITAAVSALTPGAVARSIVTPLSGTNLFPGANYEIDVNAAQANSIDGLGRLYGRLGLTRGAYRCCCGCCVPSPGCSYCCDTTTTATYSGTTTGKNNKGNRNLEEVGAGEEHVVVGTFDDPDTNETSNWFATNVTKAQVFNLGFTESEECSDEAHKNAMIVKVSEERLISTDTPGAKGWHMQRVTQIEDDKTPALNESITGSDSNYTLVTYFYDLEKNLLACAHLKKHDEDTAAMYNELLKEVVAGAAAAGGAAENVDAAAAGVDAAANDTSSGSKVGLFVFLSAFAAVGIAIVMVDVVAL